MQNIQPKYFTTAKVCPDKPFAYNKPAFKSDADQVELYQADRQNEKKSSTGVIIGAIIAAAVVIGGIYALKRKGKPSTVVKNVPTNDVVGKAETAGEIVANTTSGTATLKRKSRKNVTNAPSGAATLTEKTKSIVTSFKNTAATARTDLVDRLAELPPTADNTTVETFKGSVQLASIREQSGVFRTILKGARQKPTKTPKAKPPQDAFELINDFIIDKNFGKTNSKIIKAIQASPEAQRKDAYRSYYQKLHQLDVKILDQVLIERQRLGIRIEELDAIESI